MAFGFSIPDDFMRGLKDLIKKTLDDIEIGDHWRDADDTLWRIIDKSDKIHIVSTIGLKVREVGINIFLEEFSFVEFGVDCSLCKKRYEYTERVDMFKCWSCKNGA